MNFSYFINCSQCTLQIHKTNSLLLLFLIIFNYQCTLGQVKKEKDSAKMYKNIEKYSKKSKFGKMMHKLIFEPTSISKSNPIRKPKPRKYKSYQGKIIRNIKIETLDPFGYSEIDTTRKPRNWGERTGNKIHLKTSQMAIRNLLLLKKNKPLDSLLVKESERLIRTQRYINRVVISAELTSKSSDSVDVLVRVIDSWSLIPKGSISSTRASIELNERNFLGSGHQFNNKFVNRLTDGKKAYGTTYTVPNFKNTFINTSVNYNIDLDDYYSKSINIERPFYSPFAKWAGGIYIDQQFRKDTLQDVNLVYAKQNFKYNSQDVWGGKAIKIFNGNSENDRTTNLILSARILNLKYIESPTLAYDSINFYADEQLFLSGIGISSRQFVEDRYIFNNGIIEDIPVGKIYGITSGYQIKNNTGRVYVGARAAFGNYFKWGYLSTNFEYGTFFKNFKTSQAAFTFQANYFTNLIDIGKWKLRQFIKPQIIIGNNRLSSIGDNLNINENYGINGFTSALYGTKKFVLTLQTQAYSPWKLIGFRLNPYFNYAIAALGNAENSLQKSKVYSKIGIGLVISNDYLVFSSFQLSLAYYPSIPGNGENLFKTNTFETSDFGFQDFELAKPRLVNYK